MTAPVPNPERSPAMPDSPCLPTGSNHEEPCLTSAPKKLYPKAYRMVSPKEFQKAFRTGSRAKAKFLIVVVVETDGPTRLGLSVGKRIFKLAHRRNRLKRQIREAFRLEYQALPKGLDLVIVPAIPGASPTLEQAREELVYLSAKANRRLLEKRTLEARP